MNGNSPDWGVYGAQFDNPSLLADNVSGNGPEIIHIPRPADGVYTVVVHDYPSSAYWEPNEVQVDLIQDEIVHTEILEIEGEDSYTTILQLEISGGVISVVNESLSQ